MSAGSDLPAEAWCGLRGRGWGGWVRPTAATGVWFWLSWVLLPHEIAGSAWDGEVFGVGRLRQQPDRASMRDVGLEIVVHGVCSQSIVSWGNPKFSHEQEAEGLLSLGKRPRIVERCH